MAENEIKILESKYSDLLKSTHRISNQIIEHLHRLFDEKLDQYNTWDAFLLDINTYASGNTFGKLMYINYAKNHFNKLNNS